LARGSEIKAALAGLWRRIPFRPLLLAAFASHASSAEPEIIQWATPNSPPIYIHDGPDAGKGYGDLGLAYLIDNLPDYKHDIWAVDTPRALFEMQRRDGICFYPVVKTAEREAFAVFSARPVPLLGFTVVTVEDKRSLFSSALTSDGKVELTRLRASETLKGGNLLGQPYSEAITNLLNDSAKPLKLVAVPQLDQLQKMLRAGFIDFYFYYPYLAHLPAGTPPLKSLLVLPIENEPQMVKAYVACSRGARGEAVIKRIDLLLSNDQHWRAFIAPIQSWVTPARLNAAGAGALLP
jgi:uncharacterized protein (TIGR02285 family)